MERESIEWTNGWRDDADNPVKRRWLLIGDSVAREWRGRLQEMIQPINISVDFFATSLHIEDPAFFKELRHFLSFEEYRYEIVMINWGGHHGFSRRCLNDDKVYLSYKTHYENLMNYVRDTALSPKRGGAVVVVNSTPEVLSENLAEFDIDKNREIAVRNRIALELAAKCGVPYVNHFEFILANKHAFNYRDHVHFCTHNEYILLARVVLYWLVDKKILTNSGDIIPR